MCRVAIILAALAFATPALAAAPVITAPQTATVQQSQQTLVKGISVAQSGTPAPTFTVTVSDTTGALYATGPSVTSPVITGSGTSSLKLVGNLTAINAALSTLEDWAGPATSDSLAIAAVASGGTALQNGTATPASIAVTVTPDPATYLTFATPALALARSQAECAARGCDGKHTVYWWPIMTLSDGTAAIIVAPSNDANRPATATLSAAETQAVTNAMALGSLIPIPTTP